jgi:hypothetical protein
MRAQRIKTGWFHRIRVVIAVLIAMPSVGALACSLENPAEFLDNAAALAHRFWFTSLALGGLTLCLDVCERRLSLTLSLAGWLLLGWGVVVYRYAIPGYLPDCSVPLLDVSRYVLGLTSLLFGWRVLAVWRPKFSH